MYTTRNPRPHKSKQTFNCSQSFQVMGRSVDKMSFNSFLLAPKTESIRYFFKGEPLSWRRMPMYHRTFRKTKRKLTCEGVNVESKRGQATFRLHDPQLLSANPHINSMGNPHKHL